MNQQTNYQFLMIPQQLSRCLDENCYKMLSTLIDLNSLLANENGWFFRCNKDLQLDTRFSQNLVIATLDTLYQAGIIVVDSIGKGRGHRSNRIHINFESFKKYEQYSFNDIRNNPDLWIETVPYKNHYSPSYCKEKGKEIGNTLGKRIGKKVTTNIDTINTKNKINNKIIKEDNMLVTPVEENNTTYDDSERNIVMEIKEKPCSQEELKKIYLTSFGELLNNYPGLNYSMVMCNQGDSFYDCYQDIMNELLMNIHQQSKRNISKEDILKTLNNYLCYVEYSCQG